MTRPKYAPSVDLNEKDVVKALKQIGCKVERIGKPVDLLVGYRGYNFLIEVKNEQGFDTLTPDQKKWLPLWRGQVRIVHTPEEAIELVTKAYGG